MPDTPEKGPAQGRPLNGSAFARTARLASLPVGFAGRTTLGLGKRIVGTPANLVLDEVSVTHRLWKVRPDCSCASATMAG